MCLVAAMLVALPAAAKNMFYVPKDFGYSDAWYLVLNETEKKARLVGALGSIAGTYTDNGTEILVKLNKPFSVVMASVDLVCNQEQYT